MALNYYKCWYSRGPKEVIIWGSTELNDYKFRYSGRLREELYGGVLSLMTISVDTPEDPERNYIGEY